MSAGKKIMAICGSTREHSSNHSLINAIIAMTSERLGIRVFDGLTELPHFNPDHDTGSPPEAVIEFRKQLNEVDGILICTPEYAMGVPGTLKNAIDWTVSSMEFSHKPVALITASLSGQKAHLSLLDTLLVIESDIPESSRLVIPFIKTKVKDDKIIDEQTLHQVSSVMESLIAVIDQKASQTTT